jgi:putative transposase
MEKMVEVQRATQDELRQELRALFQGAIRITLEMVLEEEVKAMVGARRFERIGSRRDHRNGTFLRRFLTSMGQIEVAVPRSRGQGSPVDVLGRYQRRAEEIDEMIAEAYVGGVSQRKMGEVTEALMGESVGRSTVSRVAKRLDQAVDELRKQPIEGPHPYLYLDATFLDARWARKVENVSALMAYAVGPDGRRRLLGITLGSEESENSWAELLDQLVDRGLSGVQLVIADGHAGLAAAVRRFLPEARQQRCTVHLVRNVTAKVPRRLRKRVAREVGAIFQAPSLGEAKKRLAEVRARWATELPEAMEVLERGFGAATQFYAFPKAHWPRLRTTNGLERLHAEVKRRIRAVGAFPDRASALRLITAVALRATEAWASRRYLDVSLLEEETEGAAKAA